MERRSEVRRGEERRDEEKLGEVRTGKLDKSVKCRKRRDKIQLRGEGMRSTEKERK